MSLKKSKMLKNHPVRNVKLPVRTFEHAWLLCRQKKYPEIKAFLRYWDFRKSHVFGPFRGCGVPGVNLAEPANRTFKPPQKLSLVEAAKYDVATLMWQETQIDLFERNLLKCSGCGPSKGVRDSKKHARQMKVAADFEDWVCQWPTAWDFAFLSPFQLLWLQSVKK